MLDSDASTYLKSIIPELTAFRRDLHSHPEIAFEETRTAAKITEWLAKLPGMTIETDVGGTPGVFATLGAEKTGPCIALRADIDALPMDDRSGKSYASQIPGRAHTCGHDGHTACLIGAATLLAHFPERLKGPVRFIFQPAEEGGGGARYMIKGGALENPRPVAIFGLHCWPSRSLGTICLRKGPMMAATNAIEITIIGRGGHASAPHSTIDPIPAAAQVISSLQSVISRRNNPTEPGVVTISRIHGGSTNNVIPDSVTMGGTMRTYSADQRQRLMGAVRSVVENVATAYGCTAEVNIKDGYPVVVNDADLYDYAVKVTRQLVGDDNLDLNLPLSLGGEDFAFYGEIIPALFLRLGNADPADPTSSVGLHNSSFCFNDAALPHGVSLHCSLVWNWPLK